MTRRRVVIVGGGFAGLSAAKGLRRADVHVTVVDRRNHHLFQPLLYQVATSGLAPADIAEPIRSILSRQSNTDVRLGEASGVDTDAKALLLSDGTALPYDWLVLAAGVRHSYFGNDAWADAAPGLKTIGDALEIRRRVLLAYERAEWETDPAAREKLLTFVVVGAGPTGVELAGAIADIARRTLARDFHHIDTRTTRVVLVEAGPAVLGAFDSPLPDQARAALERIGVQVRTGKPVSVVDADGVVIDGERIHAATVLWAAGVQAPTLGRDLGETDRAGRVVVGSDLSVPDHADVFVVGDQAHVDQDGRMVPGVAPAALQMGDHVARCIRADLAGKPRPAFRYSDKGSMATIGRSKAVVQVGRIRMSGFVAWVLWVFVHLMTLVSHRNRAVVFVKWAWAWFTFDRSSRLVWQTEPSASRDDA